MTDKLTIGTCTLFGMLSMVLLLGATATAADTGLDATRQEVKELKEAVGDLAAEVKRLKEGEPEGSHSKGLDSALGKLHFGGYGEMHANFTQGSESDQFDFHRMVLYLGYDFADWITFHSELEVEHAYVSDGSGGELSMEQAYVDFQLSPALNVRAGRILTPLGIINAKHEPTTFNGVERPSFA